MRNKLKSIKILFNIIGIIAVLGLWIFILYPDFNFNIIFSDSSPFTSGIFVLIFINFFILPLIEEASNKRSIIKSLKNVKWFSVVFLFIGIMTIGLFIEGIPHIYIWEINGSPMGFRSDKWDVAMAMVVVLLIFTQLRNQVNLSSRLSALENKFTKEVKKT